LKFETGNGRGCFWLFFWLTVAVYVGSFSTSLARIPMGKGKELSNVPVVRGLSEILSA
jgi:hypothetical protein